MVVTHSWHTLFQQASLFAASSMRLPPSTPNLLLYLTPHTLYLSGSGPSGAPPGPRWMNGLIWCIWVVTLPPFLLSSPSSSCSIYLGFVCRTGPVHFLLYANKMTSHLLKLEMKGVHSNKLSFSLSAINHIFTWISLNKSVQVNPIKENTNLKKKGKWRIF